MQRVLADDLDHLDDAAYDEVGATGRYLAQGASAREKRTGTWTSSGPVVGAAPAGGVNGAAAWTMRRAS